MLFGFAFRVEPRINLSCWTLLRPSYCLHLIWNELQSRNERHTSDLDFEAFDPDLANIGAMKSLGLHMVIHTLNPRRHKQADA